MKAIRIVYDWMGSKVQQPYAEWWLVAFFFIESSIFIIPVDPLLILFCLQNSNRGLHYAAIATFASVAGGAFGYLIGACMWQTIGAQLVYWLISESTFNALVAKYTLYETWAVLIGGFTPVPYKAITISAGFCKLPFAPFIIFSLIARAARFFMLAGAIYYWGPMIKTFIDKYFNTLVVAFALLVIGSCLVVF
ncbi:DedA family protein [Candidatus Dependentiae bacterium]|nr:DedA family protein [Candidatus Dependentiae bacterium]